MEVGGAGSKDDEGAAPFLGMGPAVDQILPLHWMNLKTNGTIIRSTYSILPFPAKEVAVQCCDGIPSCSHCRTGVKAMHTVSQCQGQCFRSPYYRMGTCKGYSITSLRVWGITKQLVYELTPLRNTSLRTPGNRL